MAEEKLVSGVHIVPLRDFISQNYDDASQQLIRERLSEDTRDMLDRVNRSEWHPVRMVSEINRGIYLARGDHEAGYKDVVLAGAAIAQLATNTFLRLLIKLMTPEIMARKWPTVWKKFHNFGTMKTDLDAQSKNRLVMQLSDVDEYDYIGPSAVGFLTYSLNAMGMPDARVIQKGDQTVACAPAFEFEITW